MATPEFDFDAESFLRTLTTKPGVYRMEGANGSVLYVGKARNLKKRVASYFRPGNQVSPKIRSLMDHTRRVEVTITRTEGEALLLENNLIKEYRPRYNVVLRDDKSYPYIYLATEHAFPVLSFHRGARRGPGRYFGPYPGAGAVRETLNLLQKLFRVRQCDESFFRNRKRPCLQYQIDRCTAPCVDLVTREEYREDVRHAVMFLEGKSGEVVDELAQRMEAASQALQFEKAADLRDKIASLRRVQQRQYITSGSGNFDVIAVACQGGIGCIQVFSIRDGRHLGNQTFFPEHTADTDESTILGAFLSQFYLTDRTDRTIPAAVLLSHEIEDAGALAAVLSERAGRRVSVARGARGGRAKWIRMALENVALSLAQRLSTAGSMRMRLEALQSALGLDEPPLRIECFDISHTRGESATASCVVFGPEGPAKSQYRLFNIEGIEPGDDYAAMRQAIRRRYTRVQKEEGMIPDVLLIDGGKGQLHEAVKILEELQIIGVTVTGVAKGPGRKPGLESLFLPGHSRPLILPPDSPALHLVQQVRDEAHRFAITGHRKRRAKSRVRSRLEEVPGIGAKRRRLLLRQFGGLQGIARAGVEDLAKLDGISSQLAQKIYDAFHAES